MQKTIFKDWWLVALKGGLAVVLGILALAMPRDTIHMLTVIFGIFSLIGGSFLMTFAITNRQTLGHWKVILFEGVIDIVLGVFLLVNPELTAYLLTMVFGAWMIVGALFQIWFAIRHRSEMKSIGLPLTNGIVTLCLGAAITFHPLSGIVVLSWIIGFTVLLFGGLLLVLALQMRTHNLNANE